MIPLNIIVQICLLFQIGAEWADQQASAAWLGHAHQAAAARQVSYRIMLTHF